MAKIEVNKLQTLTGHNDCIYALTEGSDPRFFYTGSGDGMVVEWDLDLPKDGKLIDSPVNITAIPYFAWANRGSGEMTVWLATSKEYSKPLPPPTIASGSKITIVAPYFTKCSFAR